MEKTATIYHLDGREMTLDVHEASRLVGPRQVGDGKGWSFVKPPPEGWELTVPKYRVARDVRPAERPRYRLEPPFSTILDPDIWQYAERAYAASEIIESKAWPHESFQPLNYSAEQVLSFFKGALRSRLPTTPWYENRVRLDNGLSGPATPDVRPPQVKPMDLRPVA
jgi:hypothetical protein